MHEYNHGPIHNVKIKSLTFNKHKYGKLYFVLFFLFLLIFIVWPSVGFSGPPPAEGDWIINDVTIMESQTIILNGNLIVQPAGRLTLNDVTLTLNSSYDGQYGIVVNQDGAMFINNSVVASENQLHTYNFAVHGSSFEMKNSELHHCG